MTTTKAVQVSRVHVSKPSCDCSCFAKSKSKSVQKLNEVDLIKNTDGTFVFTEIYGDKTVTTYSRKLDNAEITVGEALPKAFNVETTDQRLKREELANIFSAHMMIS